jgi:hypothetical protein
VSFEALARRVGSQNNLSAYSGTRSIKKVLSTGEAIAISNIEAAMIPVTVQVLPYFILIILKFTSVSFSYTHWILIEKQQL